MSSSFPAHKGSSCNFGHLYTITDTFILPYTNTSLEQSFTRTLLDLSLPFISTEPHRY
ncbi:hypothetical protein BGW80DRAFT_1292657 [Lactifluus volemus]|nr:hypothetical protein BGW80DRAFT_1292657 [Lactifluus volemus]